MKDTGHFAILLILLLTGCSSPAPEEPVTPEVEGMEAVSLLGQPLVPAQPDAETLARLEENLARATAEYEADPSDADRIIWLGRRTAYLARYREAIAIYTRGIELHPADPRLYRHRGHRYITTRRLDDAIDDLRRAAELIQGHPDEIEPDGIPNERNQPTSTNHTNIWYHLGLAHYLKGEFREARQAYRACMEAATNPDMKVATAHWLYMTLRRMDQRQEAALLLDWVNADLDIIENRAYLDLLLFYKGIRSEQEIYRRDDDNLGSATVGYGIGNWHLYNGDSDAAFATFAEILGGSQWASFGFIASEAEVANRNGGSN